MQARSYCYIDDSVESIYTITHSGHHEPTNLRQDRMIILNELVENIANISGAKIRKRYEATDPQRVIGRDGDNTGSPEVSLEIGLGATYNGFIIT